MDKYTGFVTTSDGRAIAYDHYRCGHRRAIILAHGFYNSKRSVLFRGMAADLGGEYDVVVMDFSGHGRSAGLFSWTVREDRDLIAVLEYARPQYAGLGVVGFSLGAAVSLITASRVGGAMDSLVAVCAPSDFDKIDNRFWAMGWAGFEENIIYNIFGRGRLSKGVRPGNPWCRKVRPIDIVGDIRCPVFFIHGRKDWLIRPWHSQALYEKTRAPKRLDFVENATHAEFIYRRKPEAFIRLLKEWFAQTLPAGD